MLSLAIQAARPELKPAPEASDQGRTRSMNSGGPSNISASSSSQRKSKDKSGTQASSKSGKKTRRAKKRSSVPQPPKPYPPLSMRLSSYSPALEVGIVKETFKAGMDKGQLPGTEMFLGGGGGDRSGPGGSGAGGGPSGMGGHGAGMGGGGSKGKRKVIRVRG
jgi:signal recognition particle subunit SRP19